MKQSICGKKHIKETTFLWKRMNLHKLPEIILNHPNHLKDCILYL